MSFPRYPKYKASGIEWLGDVPEHWEVRRLKSIARQPIQNGVGAAADTDTPGLPRYVRITDIKSTRELHADTFRSLPVEVAETASFSVGDILFACVGATFGKSYLHCADIGPVCYAGYLVRFSPKRSFDSRYVSSWSESSEYWSQLNANVIQSTVQNFSASKFRELWLAIPALDEQSAIASFLDKEMSKIDGLVGEQRRLIELLKEKRQAVISHAVTKGLNPHAPLKPSGIEWLGDVPEHWTVMRLKQLSRTITDGEHISPSVRAEGIPLLSAKDVRDWRIDYDVDKYVTEDDAVQFWKRCNPENGDVLIVSRGATVGRIGVVEKSIAFCLMGSVILCKPMDQYNSAFLYFVLNAKHSQTSLWFSSASSAQQAIYIRDVAEVPVAVPPTDERDLIVKFLMHETAKLDSLTAEAERGIELLQERRTALISAAVTGQIDVRGLVTS